MQPEHLRSPAAKEPIGSKSYSVRERLHRDMSKKLFIGNLYFRTSADTLKAAFEQNEHGSVEKANIACQPSGESKGYGFVTFTSPEACERAVESMQGAKIEGWAIRSELARSQN